MQPSTAMLCAGSQGEVELTIVDGLSAAAQVYLGIKMPSWTWNLSTPFGQVSRP